MQSFALTLARNGYMRRLSISPPWPNPAPMTGDLTRIDGTTRLLVDATPRSRRGARSGRCRLAVLGHSMASDIVVRFAETSEVAATIASRCSRRPSPRPRAQPSRHRRRMGGFLKTEACARSASRPRRRRPSRASLWHPAAGTGRASPSAGMSSTPACCSARTANANRRLARPDLRDQRTRRWRWTRAGLDPGAARWVVALARLCHGFSHRRVAAVARGFIGAAMAPLLIR